MKNDIIEKQPHECPYLNVCPFFTRNQNDMADLCKKLKKEVCLQDNTHCARLRVRDALGMEFVPTLMMPHQHEWADQILLDASKKLSEHPR